MCFIRILLLFNELVCLRHCVQLVCDTQERFPDAVVFGGFVASVPQLAELPFAHSDLVGQFLACLEFREMH